MEPTCDNCKYRELDISDHPCSKCIDSFCGMKFSKPSDWEASETITP